MLEAKNLTIHLRIPFFILPIRKSALHFQGGAETGVCFFSRRGPIAFINGWSHQNQASGKMFTGQTMDTLKRSPPDLVVLAKYFIHVKPNNRNTIMDL
jgi:hypothetical protein